MNAPRTAREALIAEMLGELDRISDRVEALPALVASAEDRLALTVGALNEAGDKYRMAVTAFNEQAKADLSEFFDRKAAQVASKTGEEMRASMQEAALLAFNSHASEKASRLGVALGEAAKEFRRSMWSRLAEHAITAFLASGCTAVVVFALVRSH